MEIYPFVGFVKWTPVLWWCFEADIRPIVVFCLFVCFCNGHLSFSGICDVDTCLFYPLMEFVKWTFVL